MVIAFLLEYAKVQREGRRKKLGRARIVNKSIGKGLILTKRFLFTVGKAKRGCLYIFAYLVQLEFKDLKRKRAFLRSVLEEKQLSGSRQQLGGGISTPPRCKKYSGTINLTLYYFMCVSNTDK